MPSKKFHSGSPLGAIRDSRWLNFVNAGAEIAQRASYEGGDVTVDPGRTSVLVRNSTGDALDRFSIVGIKDILISPTAKEAEFLNHFALDADTPDTERDGPGRIAVLQAPLAADKIGPALLWGMTPVKIDLPDSAVYTAASIITDDAAKLDADNDGDIPVVWHEDGPGEKWALVHLGVGGGGGGGGTTLVDGCECNSQYYAEGAALEEGSPTVCCESHKRWTIDLGDTIGVKTFYHLTDDIWSTYNDDEDLDNPIVVECYPSNDVYDAVLELTSTGATITLEARETLNCPEVCFVYEKIGQFHCKGPNQFRLVRHDGFDDIPVCLCIKPRLFPSCDELECASTAVTAIIRGLPVMDPYDHDCGAQPVDCGCHCTPDYSSTETVTRTEPLESICGFNDCVTFKKGIGSATIQGGCCRDTVGCNVSEGDIVLWACVQSTGNVQVRLVGPGLQVIWRKTTGAPHPCNEEITLTPLSSEDSLSSCSFLELESLDPITIEFVGQGLPSQSGHCAACGA